MAKTCPQDLRDAVAAAIQAGSSRRAAAERFGVSASSATRWHKLVLEHGQAIAKPRGGDRQSAKNDAYADFIRELLARQPDLTLVQIRDQLHERGATLTVATVARLLVRHEIKRVKKRCGRPRKTESET